MSHAVLGAAGSVRVLVVDDHAIVRQGLIQLLARQPDMREFGEAGSVAEAIERTRDQAWDVVLLDLALPDGSGLDALRAIRDAQPQVPVLILTMFPEDQLALRLLKSGAAGYLTKESAPEELVKAVRLLLQGHRYLSPAMTQALTDSLATSSAVAPHERLSDRELAVMRLLAAGRAVKDIGRELAISPKTVTTYRARVLRKMAMRTNAELTYYAAQHRLLTAPMLRAGRE